MSVEPATTRRFQMTALSVSPRQVTKTSEEKLDAEPKRAVVRNGSGKLTECSALFFYCCRPVTYRMEIFLSDFEYLTE